MMKRIRFFSLLLLAAMPLVASAQTITQAQRARMSAARKAEMQAFEQAVALYYHQRELAEEGGVVRSARPTGIREISVQIQIFLDQACFGPGKIDGQPGEFTSKALARYQRVNGLPETGRIIDALSQLPLDKIDPIYVAHTLTEEDARKVGPVPRQPAEQAKLSRMPYPSLLKYLEERYHCAPELIYELNPHLDVMNLKVGDVVYVPNVKPFRIEDIKPLSKMPTVEEYKQRRRVEIDTREKFLELYEDDRLIAAFPITPGGPNNPAPPGRWRIVGIATMPWYRWDEGVLKHGVRTNHFYNIPAGPSSPVGIVWMGLNKPGIGLHGTNNPQTIGRAGSSGCIRLANWDAIRLAGMVSEGTKVTIDGYTLAPPAATAER